jgi:hypothetical protein
MLLECSGASRILPSRKNLIRTFEVHQSCKSGINGSIATTRADLIMVASRRLGHCSFTLGQASKNLVQLEVMIDGQRLRPSAALPNQEVASWAFPSVEPLHHKVGRTEP